MLLTLPLTLCVFFTLTAVPAQDPGAAVALPLPGRELDVAGSPPLADDHGTRAGVRLADAAVDHAGRFALVFTEGSALIVCVGEPDSGLSAPVRLDVEPGPASGSFWGPQIARDGDRVVLIAVLAKRPGRDGDVFAWRSDDGGESFGTPQRLNAQDDAAQEVLVDLAVGSSGRLAVAWMHTDDGVVRVQGAESDDFGASWGADRAFARSSVGSLCPCCPPALAFAPGASSPWLIYRDDLDGYRDMHLVEVRPPDAAPARALKLGEERWELGGCPMSVGTLRVDADGPEVVYRRKDELFLGLPTTPSSGSLSLSEESLVKGRWPLRTLLRRGDDAAPLLLWRESQTLRARVPGEFLDRDLGAARRVALADTLDPAGPVLLAAELADGAGGWRLSLHLLQSAEP